MSCNEIRAPHPQSHVLRPSLVDWSDTHPHHQALHTLIPQIIGSSIPLVTFISTPSQQESRSQIWRGGTPMHTEGCPPSPHTPVTECPPLAPVQKQVQFNLGAMI